MSFKVQVGPPQISIHHGQTVVISEQDGQIKWPSDKGLSGRDAPVPSWSPIPQITDEFDAAR